MGVNFVIIAENILNRTQEEINKEFGVRKWSEKEVLPEWELLTYKGKSYAQWQFPPRFFVKEEEGEEESWEALRKYLVRAKNFFGGDILMTNDVVWFGLPEKGEEERPGYYLPGALTENELAPPDYEKHPELRNIEELEGLIW